MTPLVSAIIPTQSRPAMLRQAAASVLGQTFRDLELIIVLNDATLEATEAARNIASAAQNVRLVHLERGNLAAARNAGISCAAGEWVAFLDDDDEWFPTKIEDQLNEVIATTSDVIACNMVQFDDRGDLGPIGAAIPAGLSLSEALTVYNCMPGSASGSLVRTQAIRSLNGFDERMLACEDWDMWRRLSWHHRISHINVTLARYRVHNSSMSRQRWMMVRAELWHMLKMTFDTPPKLRHVLPRAWCAMFWRIGANLYMAINQISGGHVRIFYRRFLKPMPR